MQRLLLEIIFIHVVLYGLISAFPSNNHLERGDSSIDLQSRDERLVDTNFGHASNKSKRGFSRSAVGQGPGFQCGRTFYKQSKVDAVVAKACRNANNGGFGSVRKTLPKLFRASALPYTGPAALFPGESASNLSMLPISNHFAPTDKAGRLLKLSGNDFMVFAGQCRPVGVVRNTSGKDFTRCTSAGNRAAVAPSGPPPPYTA